MDDLVDARPAAAVAGRSVVVVLHPDDHRGKPRSHDPHGKDEGGTATRLGGNRRRRGEDRDVERQEVLVLDQLYCTWNRYSSTATL